MVQRLWKVHFGLDLSNLKINKLDGLVEIFKFKCLKQYLEVN